MDQPRLPTKYMNEHLYIIIAPLVLAFGEYQIGVVQKNGECRHFTVVIKAGDRMVAEAVCFETAEEAAKRGQEILGALQAMLSNRLGHRPVDTMAN